jgi:hypothetical protein
LEDNLDITDGGNASCDEGEEVLLMDGEVGWWVLLTEAAAEEEAPATMDDDDAEETEIVDGSIGLIFLL